MGTVNNAGRYCNIVRSTDLIAPTTIYETPATGDFYLCSAWANIIPADDAPHTRIITATIDGQQQIILKVITNDNSASAPACNSINPCYPIKIDRGTNIVVTGVNSGGSVGIIGFTVEP